MLAIFKSAKLHRTWNRRRYLLLLEMHLIQLKIFRNAPEWNNHAKRRYSVPAYQITPVSASPRAVTKCQQYRQHLWKYSKFEDNFSSQLVLYLDLLNWYRPQPTDVSSNPSSNLVAKQRLSGFPLLQLSYPRVDLLVKRLRTMSRSTDSDTALLTEHFGYRPVVSSS